MSTDLRSAEVVVPLVGDSGRYANLEVDAYGHVTIRIEDMSLSNEILELVQKGKLDTLFVAANSVYP